MKILLLLLALSLASNIYQYRQNNSLMEKHGQLKVSLEQKKYLPAPATRTAPQVPKISAAPKPAKRIAPRPMPEQDDEDEEGEEEVLKAQEERREWQENVQNYFVEELSLEPEDWEAYLKSIDILQENRERIYDFFTKRDNREQGEPYVPTFEEERALFRAQESAIMSIGRRIGNEKFKHLLEYERQMKRKMLKDKGYYTSHGLF